MKLPSTRSIGHTLTHGVLFGLSATFTIILVSLVYATASWGSLPTVNSGSGLTATAWNDLVAHVNQSVKQTSPVITVSGSNVGIGNANPGATLEVGGTFNITGIHTAPNQAGFLEYIGTTGAIGFLSGTTDYIDRHSANYNIGNYWNRTTGKFTAPVTGRYLVNIHIMGMNVTDVLDLYLAKNSNFIARTYANTGLNYKLGIIDGVWKLNAGDYLQLYNSNSSIYSDDSWFSVNLLD